MNTSLVTGLTVRARGERFTIVEVESLSSGSSTPLSRLTLRGLEGELRGAEVVVLYPVEPSSLIASRGCSRGRA